MKEKFLRFLRTNFIIWSFWAVILLIELTAVCVTSGKFWIRNPVMLLSVLAIFTCVLFAVKRQNGRYWCAFAVMLIFFFVDLIFIIVFDMTGSTFDFSMLRLRGDAMAIVESVPVDFVYVLVSGVAISLYMLLARYYMKKVPEPMRIMPYAAVASIMAAVLALHACAVYFTNRGHDPSDLSYKLTASGDGTYYDKGIMGNLINELYKGAFFGKVKLGDETELENYVYSSVYPSEQNPATDKFGTAKGYNVVTVLAESFEWFSFMNDFKAGGVDDAFPGGFNSDEFNADEATLRSLYKNLYRLYDSSTVCLNHHAREKTDISENQAIMGNYPTDCYINYDYPKNTVPYSLPNVMRSLYGVESYSFHNGDYDFYNRSVCHENTLGFAKFTAREQMAQIEGGKFTDYYAKDHERDLDSEMIEACKEEMFPLSRRFNTFITTITMHGQYEERKNLRPYYEQLADAGIIDSADDVASAPPFVHYAAAALDFDKAIGIMLDYLEETGLMKNTLLVVFGDHNVYYQSLGNDVKKIYMEEKNGRNYTDLFRVPLIVRVGNQTEQQKITKFTTTTDIVPTVLDLLGIKYYNALNYGGSIFADEESVLYSRAYDVFITDKMFFTSLKNIQYKSADVSDDYIKDVTRRALDLLDKTSHVNRIFYYDFLSGDRAETYYKKLNELNA